MANSIAYLAIIIWPFVTFILMSRVGVSKGSFLAIMFSYLMLPAGFEINFSGIPPFTKASIVSISIFLFLFIKGKKLGIKELGFKEKIILVLFVLSPIFSTMTNTDQYLHISGLSLYDGLSQSVSSLLIFFPFIIGYKYFREKEYHIAALRYFVLVVLFYSILILYEIRMSPQLHTMLYGYFPHSFAQTAREGGFRAVVFLGHGLLVALLVSVAFLISCVLWRAKINIYKGLNYNWIIVIFLFVILVLSKSYGALFIGIFGFVVLRFFPYKIIFAISYLLVGSYFVYPVMSANEVFPHQQMVNFVSNINENRAASLQFRFTHEKQLLIHANEKPLFGWGGFGRNRIYDPETFRDLSVTDGRWVITLGTRGWLGFIAEFLFIALSIYYASKAVSILKHKKGRGDEAFLLTAHAFIVALILIDQIPNSSLTFFYWLFIGILYGRSWQVVHEYHESVRLIKKEKYCVSKK